VYGPVRTAVRQEAVGDRRPYADQVGLWETISRVPLNSDLICYDVMLNLKKRAQSLRELVSKPWLIAFHVLSASAYSISLPTNVKLTFCSDFLRPASITRVTGRYLVRCRLQTTAMIGTKLAHCEITGHLGTGGMGEEDQEKALLELIATGDRIGAIKITRLLYGYDLKHPVAFLDELSSTNRRV